MSDAGALSLFVREGDVVTIGDVSVSVFRRQSGHLRLVVRAPKRIPIRHVKAKAKAEPTAEAAHG